MALTPPSDDGNKQTASGGGRTTGNPVQADISVRPEGGGVRILLSGALTVHSIGKAQRRLAAEADRAGGPVQIDLQKLSLLDTAGALLLNTTAGRIRGRGLDCSLLNPNEQQKQLLQKAVLPEPDKHSDADKQPFFIRLAGSIGKGIWEGAALVFQLIGFFGHFLVTVASIIVHPSRMRWTSLVFQMEQVGLRAVPIVALLTFLIGLVVAYMGAQQLSMFGADIFAVNLLEVTVMREMAVLITSIVVAGRSSSSFTAQIGAMVANEEVDALRSMGLDPGTLLVVPRVLALVICLPMLVFIADIMALIGGAVAINFTIDLSFHAFITQLHDVASLNNFLVGIIKTPFFAMSIGLVGCFQGFRATGSAESVGFLTTISVVQSIFIVILLDALFAIFFTNIGF